MKPKTMLSPKMGGFLFGLRAIISTPFQSDLKAQKRELTRLSLSLAEALNQALKVLPGTFFPMKQRLKICHDFLVYSQAGLRQQNHPQPQTPLSVMSDLLDLLVLAAAITGFFGGQLRKR